MLSRSACAAARQTWTLPLLSFAWIIVATLYRPSITPDQPWASRRLVPVVLPGFILLAVWARAGSSGWLRQRGSEPGDLRRVAAAAGAALVLPAAMTTFGLGVRRGGPGASVTADGLGGKATYRGEITAVSSMCAAIPPDSSV